MNDLQFSAFSGFCKIHRWFSLASCMAHLGDFHLVLLGLWRHTFLPFSNRLLIYPKSYLACILSAETFNFLLAKIRIFARFYYKFPISKDFDSSVGLANKMSAGNHIISQKLCWTVSYWWIQLRLIYKPLEIEELICFSCFDVHRLPFANLKCSDIPSNHTIEDVME